MDDGKYGYKDEETGEWNGLMGELLSQVNRCVRYLVCSIFPIYGLNSS